MCVGIVTSHKMFCAICTLSAPPFFHEAFRLINVNKSSLMSPFKNAHLDIHVCERLVMLGSQCNDNVDNRLS
jgi:hypothetical protein